MLETGRREALERRDMYEVYPHVHIATRHHPQPDLRLGLGPPFLRDAICLNTVK